MPKGRYLDAEFQQLEVDRLFTKTWLMACRLEDLPGVGSYYEYLIGGHSILVVRESTDSIRGYFNACRHRGTRLATGRGRVGALICPFHGWRWNLDGSIRLVLDPEEFAPRSDDDLGLQPVQVDTWAGFVFINMDLERRAAARLPRPDPGGVRAVPLREHALPVDEERHRCRATGRPCSTGSSRRTTCPGTHPQLTRWDKRNHNIATLKELDRRAWSPTATFGKFARYASLGPKKSGESVSRLGQGSDHRRRPRGARQGPVEQAHRGSQGRAPLDRRRRAVHRQRHAGPRDRTQHPRRRTAPHGRRPRRDVRRAVLPRDAPRRGDRRRARLAGDPAAGVGRGRHGVARVPEHDPAAEPGLHHRLPRPTERQGSRQLPVRDVLPRADPGRRLRQEDRLRRRSTSTTTATPTSARCSPRTSTTPRTSPSGCTPPASTATG